VGCGHRRRLFADVLATDRVRMHIHNSTLNSPSMTPTSRTISCHSLLRWQVWG
jgi:hypothetical protein